MSALGGIYNFDYAPVDPEMLAALGNGLDARGPDGGSAYISGSIGMVYRAFHTNRESRLEKQPFVSPRGFVLCWDGRLDNRDELIAQLGDGLRGDNTDVAIVMGACEKWGIGFLERLLGDFAISLWDPVAARIILSRDPFGARTLFYTINDRRLLWGSELEPVLRLSGIPTAPSDEYVAGFLALSPDPGKAPYEGISAVEPGRFVTVSTVTRSSKFWEPDPGRQVRYSADREYEDEFRSLLTLSIQRRLRADAPVWAELSGGLDSSSIVCLADRIPRPAGSTAPLETVSYVYDESPFSDEREFIQAVEDQRGKLGHHIREEEFRLLAPFADQGSIIMPNPFHCFAQRHNALADAMKEGGAQVLLSGEGGDNMLWSEVSATPELADLLVTGRIGRLHTQACSWTAGSGRSYWDVLWNGAIYPSLPPKLKLLSRAGFSLPGWLDRSFASRMNLRERSLGPPDTLGLSLPSSREQSRMLLAAISVVSAGYYKERSCIEVAYPYLERSLVEFLLAIPIDQKVRPGESRSLQRRALIKVLPPVIARRRDKKGPEEALYRAIIREWPRLDALFTDARIFARGYVDARGFREALDRARHGCEPHTFALLRAISLEMWLRAVDTRSSERHPATLGTLRTRAAASG